MNAEMYWGFLCLFFWKCCMVLKTVVHWAQTVIGFLILARIRALVVVMLVVLPGRSVLGEVSGVKNAASAGLDNIFLPCVLNGLISLLV